jgi:hypothetical protein
MMDALRVIANRSRYHLDRIITTCHPEHKPPWPNKAREVFLMSKYSQGGWCLDREVVGDLCTIDTFEPVTDLHRQKAQKITIQLRVFGEPNFPTVLTNLHTVGEYASGVTCNNVDTYFAGRDFRWMRVRQSSSFLVESVSTRGLRIVCVLYNF